MFSVSVACTWKKKLLIIKGRANNILKGARSSVEHAHSGRENFSVGHGKFNFPPLYAEIASSSRILIVSFAIETIIVVDLKKYHAWIIL